MARFAKIPIGSIVDTLFCWGK